MAKLMFQGHGSFRIVTKAGTVVYVDPCTGDGYGLPADMILVTHEHGDHNQVQLCRQKEDCTVLRASDFLKGDGMKHTYEKNNDVFVTDAVASNKNHDPSKCVGFIIEIKTEGITIYAAGDTSKNDYMEECLADMDIDWALLPIDGVYNMGIDEAVECANIIGAKYTIPIHMVPGKPFSSKMAADFKSKLPSAVICMPDDEIALGD